MKLHNNLRKLRFDNNRITQEELARSLNVSRQTIIAIEKGKFNPSVRLALKMAKFFVCHIEDIFSLMEESENDI